MFYPNILQKKSSNSLPRPHGILVNYLFSLPLSPGEMEVHVSAKFKFATSNCNSIRPAALWHIVTYCETLRFPLLAAFFCGAKER